jgi:hypothetical protein
MANPKGGQTRPDRRMIRWLNQIRVEWLVTAFCAWHAADLLHAWRHSPYDRLGWLALIIWTAPSGRAVWSRVNPARQFKLAMVSLLLALIGVMGELNFLVYWGLAVAIGGLAGIAGRAWLWLALAVCWMPVFGWFGSQFHLPAAPVNLLRLGVAGLAACFGWRWLVTAPPNTSA